jgi:hypothetical protein
MFGRKRVILALTAAAVLVSAVSAYAYWTTSGTGNGSASVGTSQSFVVSQTNTVSGLVPGGSAQSIAINVNNPASHNQYLSALTVSVKNSDGTAWSAQADTTKPACTASDFSITQPVSPAGDLTSGNHAFSASIAMLNGSGNQDNCKGVTVPLVISAS